MRNLYRVTVELNQGGTRVWYERGNSVSSIQNNIIKILDNCLVDWKEIDVTLHFGT